MIEPVAEGNINKHKINMDRQEEKATMAKKQEKHVRVSSPTLGRRSPSQGQSSPSLPSPVGASSRTPSPMGRRPSIPSPFGRKPSVPSLGRQLSNGSGNGKTEGALTQDVVELKILITGLQWGTSLDPCQLRECQATSKSYPFVIGLQVLEQPPIPADLRPSRTPLS